MVRHKKRYGRARSHFAGFIFEDIAPFKSGQSTLSNVEAATKIGKAPS